MGVDDNQTDSKVRGLIFMNLMCFIMTVMSCIFKKLAAEGVSNLDFAVFRTLVGLFCISLYNWYKQTKPWSILSRQHYCKMLFRSFLGIWGFILYTYIITILPLTLTTVVFQTNPFWMSLLGICFLKERVLCLEIIGMFVCFGGVLMVTLAPKEQSKLSADTKNNNMIIFGLTLCLLQSWSHSFAQMTNRILKVVPWYVTMFFISSFGLITTSIIVFV